MVQPTLREARFWDWTLGPAKAQTSFLQLEVNNKGAKKTPGKGKFEEWFGFTCQVKASSLGEIP